LNLGTPRLFSRYTFFVSSVYPVESFYLLIIEVVSTSLRSSGNFPDAYEFQ
jgi:hypothetical protein